MRCKVSYYDIGNCCVDIEEFVVDSIKELEDKARDYADVLVNEGWEIAGWNYNNITEDF